MPDSGNIILLGVGASLVASLGTTVGAVFIFLVRRLSLKVEDILLSSAAGIMLAASIFSLLIPGMEYAQDQTGNRFIAAALVLGGLMLGALVLWLIHHYAPHEHFIAGPEGKLDTQLNRIWLFVIAITLHNFPEGMSVGVGFAGGDITNGAILMLGIGLQNIPEGLAVAASLLTVNYSRTQAFTVAALSGFAEPIGGLVGSVAISVSEPLMPWTLGFAAGAMLFIISDEIIPETHRHGFKTQATFSLLIGFAIMMFLDVALG